MIHRIRHEIEGPAFQAGRFIVTPVSVVTVDAYQDGIAAGAVGSKRPAAILVTDGVRTWRIEIEAAGEAPAG
jgi:hypothetical protein